MLVGLLSSGAVALLALYRTYTVPDAALLEQQLQAKELEIAGLKATVLTLTEALQEAEQRIALLEAVRVVPERRARSTQPYGLPLQLPPLLVGLGPDLALHVDLPALRATGVRFVRLLNVTTGEFARHLQRRRGRGIPYRWVHLAMHGTTKGLHFADRMVDGVWLSVHLRGIEVLFLAACQGDVVGSWLGVVPHVITLHEEVTHDDAAEATRVFWGLMGEGHTAEQAFYDMCDRCPGVAEFAELHV
jgi:hypothetical protein